MIKILIPSEQTRAVTSSKTGRRFLVQRAGLVQSDGLAQSFDLLIDPDRGEKPYAAGEYTFAPDVVYVDRKGRLSIASRFVPYPAKAAASAKVA